MTPQRRSKLATLSEAVRLVDRGARIAIGGFSLANRPMAFVREMIRQTIDGLTVVEPVCGPELELLVGAGLVDRVETSYIGLERFGLAMRSRRAIESGRLTVVEYGEVMMFDRFRATQDNWTFLPVSYLAGSSLLEGNSEIRAFECPLTGRPLHAVPPAEPDVTVVHVPRADQYGNALIEETLLPHGIDLLLTRSARKLILTAEEIVPTSELTSKAHLVQIPSFLTDAVVLAPRGAHPCPMLGMYDAEDRALQALADAGVSDEAFEEYLDAWVHGVSGHEEYLRAVDEREQPPVGRVTR